MTSPKQEYSIKISIPEWCSPLHPSETRALLREVEAHFRVAAGVLVKNARWTISSDVASSVCDSIRDLERSIE